MVNSSRDSSIAILVVIVRLFAAASIPVPIANVLAASPDNALELNFTSDGLLIFCEAQRMATYGIDVSWHATLAPP